MSTDSDWMGMDPDTPAEVVWVEAAQFQDVLDTLDAPDPAPVLERLASTSRPYDHA
jgi:uncharacterized protein (DUF1778 family)